MGTPKWKVKLVKRSSKLPKLYNAVLVAGNGETQCQATQGYTSIMDAIRGIEAIQKNIPFAGIDLDEAYSKKKEDKTLKGKPGIRNNDAELEGIAREGEE